MGLLWLVIVAAVRWALLLPPPIIARVVGVLGLFTGSALVFAAVVSGDDKQP